MIDPKFEPTARRIRARAADILAGLPVEDPSVVWARRASLLAEINHMDLGQIRAPSYRTRGVWRWHPDPVEPNPPPEAPKPGRTAHTGAEARFRPEETPQ